VNEGMGLGKGLYRGKGRDGLVLVLGKITHLRLFAVERRTHRQPSDVQSEHLKVCSQLVSGPKVYAGHS
jgi:hypothetical protein